MTSIHQLTDASSILIYRDVLRLDMKMISVDDLSITHHSYYEHHSNQLPSICMHLCQYMIAHQVCHARADTFYIPTTMLRLEQDIIDKDDLQSTLAPNEVIQLDLPNCEYISSEVFKDYTALVSINAPKLKYIGSTAFKGCKSLENIYLPECLIIGNSAFEECRNIKSIYLPKCMQMDPWAFEKCDGLRDVELPRCRFISFHAFDKCQLLETINLPNALILPVSLCHDCPKIRLITAPKCMKMDSTQCIKGDLSKDSTLFTYPIIKLCDDAVGVHLNIETLDGHVMNTYVNYFKWLPKLLSQRVKSVSVHMIPNDNKDEAWTVDNINTDVLTVSGETHFIQVHRNTKQLIIKNLHKPDIGSVGFSIGRNLESIVSDREREYIHTASAKNLRELIIPNATALSIAYWGGKHEKIVDAPNLTHLDMFVCRFDEHESDNFGGWRYFPELNAPKLTEIQITWINDDDLSEKRKHLVKLPCSNPYICNMIRHKMLYNTDPDSEKRIEGFDIIYPEHVARSSSNAVSDYLYTFSTYYQYSRLYGTVDEAQQKLHKQGLLKGGLIDTITTDNEYELAIQVAQHIINKDNNQALSDLLADVSALGIDRFMQLVKAMLPNDITH